MNVKSINKIIISTLSIYFLLKSTAYAYIGPGLAIGTIVLTIGIALFILFLIIAILYYPLKKLYLKIKKK